jgi:uncharacterized membrane protein
MKTLATAHITTKAQPKAIFTLWQNVEQWPTWDSSIEWVKLEGPFSAGSHYRLKPKGGPVTKATILLVEKDHAFNDVSHLPGAKLYFEHVIEPAGSAHTVTHSVLINGPLAWLWRRILGANIQKGLQPALTTLARLAEDKQ